MNKYIVELIGTFFLVLTIGLSANPIAIGFMLMVLVYIGGYISGGHYNPAVTLAIFLQKKISQRDAAFYVLYQLAGAVLASLVVLFLLNQPLIVRPATFTTFPQAVLMEALFTFILCSVVLHTAVSKRNTPNQFYGLAIGATVMAGAFSVGALSGGAFNPAVGIGPALVAFQPDALNNILLYLIGPLLGAVIASLVYTYTTQSDK